MLEKFRNKVNEKKKLIDSDINSSERDKKLIGEIIALLEYVDDFNRLSQSTVYCMFTFLGFKAAVDDYSKMYHDLMQEINQTYVYVNPEDFFEGSNEK